jgi:hypothetical protein
MADVPTKLLHDEATAWAKYASACRLGATPQERQWACKRAVEATERISRISRLDTPMATA